MSPAGTDPTPTNQSLLAIHGTGGGSNAIIVDSAPWWLQRGSAKGPEVIDNNEIGSDP